MKTHNSGFEPGVKCDIKTSKYWVYFTLFLIILMMEVEGMVGVAFLSFFNVFIL